jgi:hypothetical protein
MIGWITNKIEQARIFNLAQDIANWAKKNNWGEDWVIGEIASKAGYDKILKENIELKEKLAFVKKMANKL